jgi:hypothetical protein
LLAAQANLRQPSTSVNFGLAVSGCPSATSNLIADPLHLVLRCQAHPISDLHAAFEEGLGRSGFPQSSVGVLQLSLTLAEHPNRKLFLGEHGLRTILDSCKF